MNYLLDTCVLSEFTRRKPDTRIIQFLDAIEEDRLYISVITIGEIQYGIERLEESPRKTELKTWLYKGLIQRFDRRILPLESGALLFWGSLYARLEKAGRPLPVMDSLIAATAHQDNLVLVTRNTADFLPCGIQMINPWEK